MSRPRVLVASDRIGDLASAAAGGALAAGFSTFADVAVLPVASGGTDLAAAAGALLRVEAELDGPGWWLATDELVVVGFAQPPRPGWEPEATTDDLGEWVAHVLRVAGRPRVVVDLTGVTAHDAGAGLLAAAGPLVAGRRLEAVVSPGEMDLPATGATGMLARRAHGAGADLAELLEADAALRRWAEDRAPGMASLPGSGAAGGSALAVLGSGGELLTGTQFCYRLANAEKTIPLADLIVTGCTELAGPDRGGDVVSAVVGWADEAERPCIAFTTGTALARRELRTFGLEAAHLVGSPATGEALEAAAARIAAGWFPGGGSRDVH